MALCLWVCPFKSLIFSVNMFGKNDLFFFLFSQLFSCYFLLNLGKIPCSAINAMADLTAFLSLY